jgi:hypothetical protein
VADDEREECLMNTPPCRRIGGHWIHADAVALTLPLRDVAEIALDEDGADAS